MRFTGLRYRDTIEFRLGILAIVAGVIFLVAVYFYQQYNTYNILRGFYVQETARYSQAIEKDGFHNLADLNRFTLGRYLDPSVPPSNYSHILSWKLFDHSRKITQTRDGANIGEPYNLLAGIEVLKSETPAFFSVGGGKEKSYGVVVPLRNKSGAIVAGLEIVYDSGELEKHLLKYLLDIHIYEALFLVWAFLVLSYIFWKRLILNPLLNFKDSIDKIHHDKSNKLMNITRHDEIGYLMVSVNGLLHELKTNIEELESTRQQTLAFSDELKSAYERLEAQITEMKEAKDQITELYMVIEKVNVDLDRKVIELSILNEVGRAMSSILDLDQLLNMIIKWAAEEMGAKKGNIVLRNEKGELIIQAVYNLDKSLIEQKVLPIDYQKALRRPEEEFVPAITIPLKRKGVTIGVVNIGGKESGSHYTPDDLNLLSTLGHQAAIAIENAKLYETIQKSYFETIQALTLAIEAKDIYTRGHSLRVTEYAMIIANLVNLPSERLENLRYAGVLHDIGKIGIQEEIIQKPGRLTDAEYSIMKKHPMIGESIIEPIVFLAPVREIVRSHHEWYNGNGYPDGLLGDQVKQEARILALADAFDSMTSNRPYRKGMELDAAIAEIERCAGKQFDPELARVFVKWLRENQAPLLIGKEF